MTPRDEDSRGTLAMPYLSEETSTSSLRSFPALSSPEACGASMETDNPFAETFPPRDLRAVIMHADCDDSSTLSSQSISAFLADEPRGSSLPSQPWRIPPAIARKHSHPHLVYEGSPLRWSYSSAGRSERVAAPDRGEAFLPTQRRLSVSSVSLDSLNARSCVTPRRSPGGSGGSGPGTPVDFGLNSSNLRMLSSHQAARIIKAEVGAVDAYVNGVWCDSGSGRGCIGGGGTDAVSIC